MCKKGAFEDVFIDPFFKVKMKFYHLEKRIPYPAPQTGSDTLACA
jgi:hypothetical protein